ncbi:MAG TPA: amidohydrolase family protein, partial [Bryobacteraceae bacterium]|nr:amidohydrolase family protein [Bryobacteraceae bacterium]
YTLASHYVIHAAVSAGLMPADRKVVESADAPVAERWKRFEPHWRNMQWTGYGEALRIAIRDVYGIREITAATIPKIQEAIRSRSRAGLYREILKDRARIHVCINDHYWTAGPDNMDPEFFVLAQKFDGYLMPITRGGVERLGAQVNHDISDLGGLKKALEKQFQKALALGLVAVKSTIAYQRDLRLKETGVADAERDLRQVFKTEEAAERGWRLVRDRPAQALSNHMFHHLAGLAGAAGIPFQIHTGLQAGNGNFLEHTRPTDLTEVFFIHPRTRFDLFHIGYPYWQECAVLGKTFPQVFIDFCWMHVVSPTGAQNALKEMLDLVPVNKIMGFGGDYLYPELSYAHLTMAQHNIARVLADKVEARAFSEEEGARLGRMLLRDNPEQLFLRKRA